MSGRKIISMFLLCSLLITALVGCSSANPSDAIATPQNEESPALQSDSQVVELTFWDENPGTNQTALYEGLINDFNSSQDRIHVTYVAIPHDSAREKYSLAVETGTTPDVGSIEMYWLANLITRDALINMDELFASWDENDQFLDLYMDLIRAMGNGSLYMMPYTGFIDVLWYRTDLLAEAGIADLRSWDNFFAAVEAMSDAPNGKFGFAMRGGGKSTNQLQVDLYSYSGITEYLTAEGKCTINDPAHIAFLEKWAGMYGVYTAKSDITAGYQEMTSSFDSGAAAMIHHNLGSYFEHYETLGLEKFAATTLPKSIQGYQLLVCNDFCGHIIFKNTKHPAEAWEFVQYLTSKQGQSTWNQNIGQMPTRSDCYGEAWIQEMQPIALAGAVMEDPSTKTLVLPTYLPDYTTIHEQYLEPEFQRLLQQEITAQEFLDQWAKLMEEAEMEYRAANP